MAVPDAIVTVVAALEGRAVRVSWVPPVSDGGSALLHYTVTPSVGTPLTIPASETECVVTGLVAGAKTFAVAAVNADGAGAVGTSNSVTVPAAAPSDVDAGEVRVAVTGRLLSAPVGTAAPTDVTSAWASDWLPLGYITDDGPTMSPKRTFADVKAWQSIDPIRTIVTERIVEWKFKLLQRNAESLKLAYGGGTIVTSGGVTTYTPPDEGELYERAFGLEVSDGTIIDRYVLSRGVVTDVADVVFKRAEATRYEVTVKALSAADLWVAVSNDPAWIEA